MSFKRYFGECDVLKDVPAEGIYELQKSMVLLHRRQLMLSDQRRII